MLFRSKLPPGVPVLAEHIGPAEFARARERLLPLFEDQPQKEKSASR